MKSALGLLAWVVWCAPALASPAAGVDCACAATGAYLLPQAPVEMAAADGTTGLSPGGKYVVSAGGDGGSGFLVSVARVSPPASLLVDLPGVQWGFSPDDDRFVILRFSGGIPTATLYDLAGASPSTAIYETPSLAGGGLLAFSPGGGYALAMSLGTQPDEFVLDVRDAASGARVHDARFAFAPPPADALPAGAEELGSVVVGFGPDARDRSLVYAYVSGNGLLQSNWSLVDLEGPTAWHTVSNYGFTWGFSPCGDVLDVVDANTDTHLKEARLFATLDFAGLAFTSYPITDDDFFRDTAASHIVQHAFTQVELAANVAGDTCGGASAVPPTAAFSAPSASVTGVSVPFTDESAPGSGQITAYRWTFGDGAASAAADPTHVFTGAGTYTVQLTVTNSDGRADTVGHDITIGLNQPPTASFSVSPAAPGTRELATFTDTSLDDDGVAYAYWQFDDGNTVEAHAVTLKVCAPAVNVHLVVEDNAGQLGELTQEVAVAPRPDVTVPAGGDLAAAVAAACPGDTLVLEAGHYAGGFAVRDVSLRGAGSGSTFIDGPGEPATADGYVVKVDPPGRFTFAGTVSLEALTVDGGGVGSDQGGGVDLAGRGHVSLSDVEVTGNAGRAGVFIDNYGDLVEVFDSHIHDNAGWGLWLDCCVAANVQRTEIAFNGAGGAAFLETDDVTVAFNDVHDNVGATDGAGLTLYDVGNGSVFGNRVFDNSSANPSGAAVAVDGWPVTLAGNLVVANRAGGLHATSFVDVVNTTIADNCGTGLLADGTTVENSVVFGNRDDVDGALAGDASNLVGVDPLFAAAGDYHLAEGSPAIDHGDNAFVPGFLTDDGDGDARVLAGVVDVGWDEWRADQTPDPVGDARCGDVDAGPEDDAGANDAGASEGDAGTAGDDAGAAGDDAGTAGDDAGTAGGGAGGSPRARAEDAGCGGSPAAPAPALGLVALLSLLRRRAGCAAGEVRRNVRR